MITLNQIKKAKDQHCESQPDSWNTLRNLCKRYIEQETNNADYGEKTKAKKKATKAATKIVKGNCKLKNNKSRKMKKNNSNTTAWVIGGLAVLGIGAAIAYSRNNESNFSTEDKRIALNNWIAQAPDGAEGIARVQGIFRSMNSREIDVMYEVVFNYFSKNLTVADIQDSQLRRDFDDISLKYNLFS